MNEPLTTKVTRLGNGWYGCRLYNNGVLIDEVRVPNRSDISAAMKDMLRWFDKMGGDSNMAHASRHRNNHLPVNRYKHVEVHDE